MPNLTKLANKGVIFTQAISTGSSTPFSFPSIFTSRPPLSHKIVGDKNGVRLIGGKTLPEVLKTEGYSTAGFNANPYLSPYFGYDRGFDLFNPSSTLKISGFPEIEGAR